MTTQRRPGRPRKAAPVVESTLVQEQPVEAEQPAPATEQAPQIQWTVAKMTPHMLAGEIHRLYQEGEDLTPVHQVSDAIKAAAQVAQTAPETAKPDADPAPKTEPSAPNVDEQKVAELKAAVLAAKTSPEKPRTIAVAWHNKRGRLQLARGVEYEDGELDIHHGYGFAGHYADDMDDLHEAAKKRHGNAYHVDYTD